MRGNWEADIEARITHLEDRLHCSESMNETTYQMYKNANSKIVRYKERMFIIIDRTVKQLKAAAEEISQI